MIWFLSLFRSFREILESRDQWREKATHLTNETVRLQAENETLRERVAVSDARVTELTDKIINAGDAMAVRALGRPAFTKTNPGPPPDRKPVDQSSHKMLGSAAARQMTQEFFQDLAKKSGVAPEVKN